MKRYIWLGVILLVSVGVWSGAFSNEKDKYNSNEVIAKVKDETITASEAMIYLIQTRKEVEDQWGLKMWQAQTGTDSNGNVITYESEIKDDTQEKIILDKTLAQVAKDRGIKLTAEQKQSCKLQAKEMMKKLDSEDLITYGITLYKMTNYCEEQFLVKQIEQTLLKDYKPGYKKEDVTNVQIYEMLIPIYNEDSKGNQTLMSSKDQKKQKKKAETILKGVREGKKIESFEKKYHLKYAGLRTVPMAELAEPELNCIKKLKNGETSQILTSGQGYVLIQLRQSCEPKITKLAIQKTIAKEKEEILANYYKKNYKKKYKVIIEKEKWDKLPLASNS